MKRQYDFSNAKRGAVVLSPQTKEKVTIRLDREILDWFRDKVDQAGGGNYQRRASTSRWSFEKVPPRVISTTRPSAGGHLVARV
jgi:BrnA antitoxin of type II toxin-antitoxin system